MVPTRKLLSGAEIPILGLGTFGSDKYSPDEVASAVVKAAKVGYRHFDCAAVYGNERQVGAALKATGLPREELWVTGKLWNDRHADPEAACQDSLRDLGLDYFDLYLIHWPFPNYHAPGVGVYSRDPHAKPYIHEDYMRTWRGLERLFARGLVRHLGTSNMTIPKLELLLRDAEVRPVANEIELHPHFQQPALFDFVVAKGILPIGYSPLGSPSRPARDRTPEDTSDLDDPAILAIAERRGITPAQVCIQWAVTRGVVPIPFSVKRSQFEASLEAAEGEPLTSEEMAAIAKIDRNSRLIKGQVFLWEGAEDWRALWDESRRG
ncbi:aldo/keto reductase [bacterium]|nr:MAG: aldo/keto reductase [bacterium]